MKKRVQNTDSMGDGIPEEAAALMRLSLASFKFVLPSLIDRRFPAADPTGYGRLIVDWGSGGYLRVGAAESQEHVGEITR